MEKVKIHGEVWSFDDIQESIEWSRGQSWTLKKYEEEDSHDHCHICYWAIHKAGDHESDEAYFYGGSTWLCKECYMKWIASDKKEIGQE